MRGSRRGYLARQLGLEMVYHCRHYTFDQLFEYLKKGKGRGAAQICKLGYTTQLITMVIMYSEGSQLIEKFGSRLLAISEDAANSSKLAQLQEWLAPVKKLTSFGVEDVGTMATLLKTYAEDAAKLPPGLITVLRLLHNLAIPPATCPHWLMKLSELQLKPWQQGIPQSLDHWTMFFAAVVPALAIVRATLSLIIKTRGSEYSLWTLMMKEVIRYPVKSPYVYMSGLLLISELVPLPFPLLTKELLSDEEVSLAVNTRKLWSAHLHPLMPDIHNVISLLAGTGCQPLLCLLRRVCWQIADLAAPSATIIARCLLDVYLEQRAVEDGVEEEKKDGDKEKDGGMREEGEAPTVLYAMQKHKLTLACTLPDKDLMVQIVTALLEHIGNPSHSYASLLPCVRTLVMLTEHDYGFYYLKTGLESNPGALVNLLRHINETFSKDSSDCLSTLSTILELLRLLTTIDTTDEGLSMTRTHALTRKQLCHILDWVPGQHHPLQDLEEMSKEEEALESLSESITSLVTLLREDGADANAGNESWEVTLPPSRPLLDLFSQRSVYALTDSDDDRLSINCWLANPALDEPDAEPEVVRCDLLAWCQRYLPDLDLNEELKKETEEKQEDIVRPKRPRDRRKSQEVININRGRPGKKPFGTTILLVGCWTDTEDVTIGLVHEEVEGRGFGGRGKDLGPGFLSGGGGGERGGFHGRRDPGRHVRSFTK
nr:hypothetical protein BaRGS_004660 [Batillaria attramentaria]